MSVKQVAAAGLMSLIVTGCASAPKEKEVASIRVVTDASLVRDCRVLGTVADNDFEDLQKKAARLGGNSALLTPERPAKGGYFGPQDYATADVYRCEGAGR